MEIPNINSTVQISSLKHDKKLHRRWEENIVLYADDDLIIGGNNQTIVEESSGKRWRTVEPAIFYFNRNYWFNVIKIFSTSHSYYYCNLSSPHTYTNKTIQYIDYDIDVIVKDDWTYDIVDTDEYERHKLRYKYPQHVQQSLETSLNILETMIEQNRDPFNDRFIEYWYEKLITCNK